MDIQKTIDDLTLLNTLCHGTVLDDAIALLKKELKTVVHCKDCKHYRATSGYCAYDRIWQENKGHIWGMYCKPDWFCADGERRTDDA